MGPLAGIALIWFIIEMLVWYLAAQFISGWYVFFWFIIAAFLGLSLLRKGLAVLNPMAKQMQTGGMMNPGMRAQESSLLKLIAMAAAGILLLIPGLVSDLFALVVILPPVQKKLKNWGNDYVMKNQQKMMEMMANRMGGMHGNSPFGSGQNPFEGMGGMNNKGGNNSYSSSAFGSSDFGSQPTTVDGTAKTIIKDVKKISSANDD